MAQYILAHDFGTSANKASLFTVEGRFVKTATADYITYHDQPSWAEQDAEDWWKAFCKSTKELMQGIDPKDVLCVSFDGTYPNCLCVDQQGKPLHRAMIWQDARAYKQAADITKKIPAKYTADKANHLMQTDRTLPKLLWIKENQPEIFEKTAMVLPCVSNYIIMKLTGNACCSYSVGKGTGMMNMENTDYADEILQAARHFARDFANALRTDGYCRRNQRRICWGMRFRCGHKSWSPAQTIPAALPSAPVFPKRAIAI